MAATAESAGAARGRDRTGLGNAETGIRAVLFDFGGVLSASPFEAFTRYERERGLPVGLLRRLNATDPHRNAWARLERGEVSLGQFAALFEDEARAAGHAIDATEVLSLLGGDPRPAMIEAVRRCRRQYLVALATNNYVAVRPAAGDSEPAPAGLESVLELFDEVIESSTLGIRKPEPAFFATCCARLGIEPHEAVFIDDLGVNLKPARELGMTTIKFISEDQAIGDLEAALHLRLSA
jgi:putative hydrolase of the HAD superfamily